MKCAVCGLAVRRVRASRPSFMPGDGFVPAKPRLGDEAAEPFDELRAGSGAPVFVAVPMVWPSHCLEPGSCFLGSKAKGPAWSGRSTVQPVRMAERAVTSAWV